MAIDCRRKRSGRKQPEADCVGNDFHGVTRFPKTWQNYFAATNAYSYDLGPNGYNAAFTNGAYYVITSPVGYFSANGYGMYDMAGNVCEYCWDWIGAPYAGGSDPRGPASGIFRVFRSGYWGGHANEARCAYRSSNNPFNANNGHVGFRCAKGL
jgi:formylglycine-generating enzyme required for sulfatase activity